MRIKLNNQKQEKTTFNNIKQWQAALEHQAYDA
jgi:hypothetical protein